MRRRLFWIALLLLPQLGILAGSRPHQSVDEDDFYMDFIFRDTDISGSNFARFCSRSNQFSDVSGTTQSKCAIPDKVRLTTFGLTLTRASLTGDCHFSLECQSVKASWSTIEVGAGETPSCTGLEDGTNTAIDEVDDSCFQFDASGMTCSVAEVRIDIDDGTDNCDALRTAHIFAYGKWLRR